MKLNDVKHNHSLTDLLKILIFSILMMIPFIDVGIRCAYVVCNKNAYQSYSGYNIETNTELATSIESGLNYQMTSNEYTGSLSSRTYIEVSNINANSNSTSFNNAWSTQQNSIKYISFGYTGSTTRFYYYRDDMSAIDSWSLNQSLMLNLSFTASNNATLNNNDLIYKVYQQQVGNSLDNVFDYSVNKLTTSELYTWTQQTAIYTGVQTMCAQLGINNTVIPLLLVYWFILTIIYIIIDIVLKLFTMLTHAIGSKTA